MIDIHHIHGEEWGMERVEEVIKIQTFNGFNTIKLLHGIVCVSVTVKLEKAVTKCGPVPRFSYL